MDLTITERFHFLDQEDIFLNVMKIKDELAENIISLCLKYLIGGIILSYVIYYYYFINVIINIIIILLMCY